ncbi:MAG: CPBP family glutamic-type intramembrane protease, partial [Spirochaetia bacterium]|nr:CPBP family glutamic-type intramembrane protease [Spirochaetia bacterium]
TGIVWALWHYPLILSTEYTNIPMQIFLPLFTAGIVISAFVYGQIRKFTQSVWPAVIMHGVANTVAFSIIDNQLFSFDNKILFYISPESATTIGLWILLSFLLFQYGKKRTNGSV